MKKSNIIILSVVGFVLILFMVYRSSYNTANEYKMNIKKSWGAIQANYQRRADLIPDLVKTVKAGAANEKDILTNVTNARAGIANFDPDQIEHEIGNAKTPRQLDAAGKKINTAINLAFEAYPIIQSTQLYSKLLNQLEGTEDRISISRQDYNDAIQLYNTHISGFLNSMFLNKTIFPFNDDTFTASPGSEKKPEYGI